MPRRKAPAHRFKVVFNAEPDGSAWTVSIPALQGCHTYGRSLAEARRNIREALSLFEEDFDGQAAQVARDAVFDEDIRLPAKVRAAVRRYHSARKKIEALDRQFTEAVRTICKSLNVHDTADLLGTERRTITKLLKAP